MAQLTNSVFKTTTNSTFPTNGNGAITALDLRTHFDNVADSMPFKITGMASAPDANDDAANTGSRGAFTVGDLWVDETNNTVYVCVDNTATAAIWYEIVNKLPAIISVAASRTLALSDSENYLEISTTSAAVVITIPAESAINFPIGTTINLTLLNTTNSATLTAAAGVTLNGVSAGSGTLTASAYSDVRLYKRAANNWIVQGAIGTVA